MTASTIGIGLMAKPPRPGIAKTRLAATIGTQAAADLARGLLSDAVETLAEAATRTPLACSVFYRPAEAASDIASLIGRGWPLVPPDILTDAAAILRRGGAREVVVMPTADGGYGLIGVTSNAAPPLFARMDWSTPVVLTETLRRAQGHGLTVHCLPEQHDIDDTDDLPWLRDALATSPEAAPATRAALARLDGIARDG